MFFKPGFWIKVGDLACAPSRKKREQNPIRPLSDLETVEIVGPVLARPFQSDPEAAVAYQQACAVAASYDDKTMPTGEQVRKMISDKDLKAGTDAFAKAEAALKPCQPLLDLLKEVIRLPKWQYPVSAEAEPDFPELGPFKRLNQCFVLDARLRWLRGDHDGALESIYYALAFSDHILTRGGLFIHFLVGRSCKTVAVRMIRAMILTDPHTDEFLAQIDNYLAPLSENPPNWAQLFEEEFRFAIIPSTQLRGLPWEAKRTFSGYEGTVERYVLQLVLTEWTIRDHPEPFNRAETLGMIRRFFEEAQPAFGNSKTLRMRLNYRAKQYEQGLPSALLPAFFDTRVSVQLPTLLAAHKAMRELSNPLGRLYLTKIFTIAANMVSAGCRVQAEASATRVCIAAARHALAIGGRRRYESLDELVSSGFLAALPSDPISGGVIQFDPERQAVWFPGPKELSLDQILKSKVPGDAWIWPIDRLSLS